MPEVHVTARAGGEDRTLIRRAMAAPLLEADRELELARAWRNSGDERALHELTTAYLRLVVSMASRFRRYGLPMSDLIQEGNVGLMLAASRFEPERGVRFSTYAGWWIRSCIQDFVLRNWSIVRTGTTAAQKSLFFNLRRLRALIDDVGDGRMTPENRRYIADQLRVPEHDVDAMAARLSAADRSLNAPIGEEGEGAEWQDMLADDRPAPEEAIMVERDGAVQRGWIAQALEGLNEREAIIVRERRLTESSVTLEALGRRLGISKERVRQIEQQALKKMRAALCKMMGDPAEVGLFG